MHKKEIVFCNQIIKREELENVVMTGKISCTRGRGRYREMMLDGLGRWYGEISSLELV